ncbi:hypothetical protein V1511DRAFT_503938 [Dipodascopsis uninucleata]
MKSRHRFNYSAVLFNSLFGYIFENTTNTRFFISSRQNSFLFDSNQIFMMIAYISVLLFAVQAFAITCPPGMTYGNDTSIVTLPYSVSQVYSIVGDFKNITWNGVPYSAVALNGTDNTVGTARIYSLLGANITETLLASTYTTDYYYQNLYASLTAPSLNITADCPYDALTVTSICDGTASVLNQTITFCSTNADYFTSLIHELHTEHAVLVGTYLGGANFTSCPASNATVTTNSTVVPPTPSADSNGATNISWDFTTLFSLLTALILFQTLY